MGRWPDRGGGADRWSLGLRGTIQQRHVVRRVGARGTRYNNFLLQPFVNYNFGGGWYLGSSPVITANWLATGDKAWTIPVGGQVGRVFKLGPLPVNLSAGAYYNADRPPYAPTWQVRTQLTFMFR
jgi:hypothetical protein